MAPTGRTVRPTSDYLREALFNSLGDRIVGARFLDLYAGTGAVGIEALSRGASHATFVEHAPAALRVLRQNIETLGFGDRAEVVAGDALSFLARPHSDRQSWNLIFADPPYRARVGEELLARLAKKTFLHPGGFVIIESFRKEEPAPGSEWRTARRIAHGDAVLVVYTQEMTWQG